MTAAPDAHAGADTAYRVLEVGGRLAHGPSERLVGTVFRRELEDQANLFDALNAADLAHALVMIEAGIVPLNAGRDLLGALLRLGERPDDFCLDPANGDLYTNREAWLSHHTPAGRWLGAGRARREATTTAFLIDVRSGLLALAETLAGVGSRIAARASDERAALMPDYTYLQAAQPTTFGHYLLGFVYPMLRDLERIRGLYRRIDRSPAGCGSTNGSRLPQDRHRLRALLGFDGLVVHARDAMWQADLPFEAAAVITALLVNLDRLAEDLQIYSTGEFGLIELDDGHARASKIMPQKKNPFALTHIRGMANTMIGTLVTSAAAGRTPSGQPDNRLPLYGSIPRAIDDAKAAAELMGEVINRLKFKRECGTSRLASGCALATELAETLVLESGLDFREAHRLVGHLVAGRLQDGDFARLTVEDVALAGKQVLGKTVELSAANLRDALDPDCAIAARRAPGGAAPEAMEAMLAECSKVLDDTRRWVGDRRQRLRRAQESLIAAVHACIATDRGESGEGMT